VKLFVPLFILNLKYSALHCTALHCTELHCTALHCTALHCTTLHCTVASLKMVLAQTVCGSGNLPTRCPAVSSPVMVPPGPTIGPAQARTWSLVSCLGLGIGPDIKPVFGVFVVVSPTPPMPQSPPERSEILWVPELVVNAILPLKECPRLPQQQAVGRIAP
jgi:hypothetical protein